MNTKQINPENLKSIMEKKGYAFFEDDSRNWNLNLVGVRTASPQANSFDDWFFCGHKYQGVWRYDVWPWTTDPGNYWLQHPLNPNGTAILVPGQYRSTWQIGLHRKSYTALVQRKPVKVYRDKDRDTVLEMDPKSIDVGEFGINIHRNLEQGGVMKVEKFSAGCQVAQWAKDFYTLMERAEDSAAAFGNWFTYTLLEEKDF